MVKADRNLVDGAILAIGRSRVAVADSRGSVRVEGSIATDVDTAIVSPAPLSVLIHAFVIRGIVGVLLSTFAKSHPAGKENVPGPPLVGPGMLSKV